MFAFAANAKLDDDEDIIKIMFFSSISLSVVTKNYHQNHGRENERFAMEPASQFTFSVLIMKKIVTRKMY